MEALMQFDHFIAKYLNSLVGRYRLFDRFVYLFSSVIPYLLFLAATIQLGHITNSLQGNLLVSAMLSALFVRFVIVESIYLFYKRPRPSVEQGIHPLFRKHIPSFPSGHAAFFGSLATSVCVSGAFGSSTFAAVTLLMCIARIVAGVHYPLDILSGLILGALSATFFNLIMFG